MNNLLRGDDVDHLEFLDRADSLKALGKNVLITKMARFDRPVSEEFYAGALHERTHCHRPLHRPAE